MNVKKHDQHFKYIIAFPSYAWKGYLQEYTSSAQVRDNFFFNHISLKINPANTYIQFMKEKSFLSNLFQFKIIHRYFPYLHWINNLQFKRRERKKEMIIGLCVEDVSIFSTFLNFIFSRNNFQQTFSNICKHPYMIKVRLYFHLSSYNFPLLLVSLTSEEIFFRHLIKKYFIYLFVCSFVLPKIVL